MSYTLDVSVRDMASRFVGKLRETMTRNQPANQAIADSATACALRGRRRFPRGTAAPGGASQNPRAVPNPSPIPAPKRIRARPACPIGTRRH